MKILLAHNYYGSSAPSGENEVFKEESQLLRQRGHTVLELTRNSDEIRNRGILGSIQGAFSTPWNPFSKRDAEKLINQENPDIFHIHNTFPLISPAVFYGTGRSRTAIVLTLHNYRIHCAAGIPLRSGKPCVECINQQSVLPAIRYRCYRGSLPATIPMTAMIWLHRRLGTWPNRVDAFIAFTKFQKDALCVGGLPRERIFVKPNFYPDPPEPLEWAGRDDKILFIGRLGIEKGCHILLGAWRNWGSDAPLLEVIGAGPERLKLEEIVIREGLGEKVVFRGQLSFKEVQENLRRAKLLLFPSLCFEGFPMVILEAYAHGVPVAASRLGSMPYMIEEGLTGTLFEAGSPDDLLSKVKSAWAMPQNLSAWGAAARKKFDEEYTADVNYRILMQIYEEAIEHRKKKLR
jgi:glycosyltransferase involved in cell wall biosynthesis